MMSALFSLLFAAAACLALGAMVATWRAYGAEVLSLHRQLAACDRVREMRFVTITTLVRLDGSDVWRPGFRPLAARTQTRHSYVCLNRQPELRPELRHAAA